MTEDERLQAIDKRLSRHDRAQWAAARALAWWVERLLPRASRETLPPVTIPMTVLAGRTRDGGAK